MANILNVTIVAETVLAYRVKQVIRKEEVITWVPKSVSHIYKRYGKQDPDDADEEQFCDICIEDWWLDKNNSELQ